VDTFNKFLGSIEGKQGGSVFFLGRQLGELVHSDQELAEVPKLQSDLREMESSEWLPPRLVAVVDEPDLALAAGTNESGKSEA